MQVRSRLWLSALYALFASSIHAESRTPLLSETLEVVAREYINPLGLEPSALVTQLSEGVEAQCVSGCNSDQSERAIALSLKTIGDVHLKLLPAVIRPGDDPGEVGDGEQLCRWRPAHHRD